PAGVELVGPAAALAGGDDGQHRPEAVPAAEVQLPLFAAQEEALVDRLQHVLRIDLLPDAAVEGGARQGDEPGREAAENLLRGGGVSGPQARHDVSKGVAGGHEWRTSSSLRNTPCIMALLMRRCNGFAPAASCPGIMLAILSTFRATAPVIPGEWTIP